MTPHARRGFTLAELMVVISIIALLAAMLMPTFSRVFMLARKTLCANKLEKIGQAYHAHNAKARGNPDIPPVAASSWPGDVLAFLGGDPTAVICPESDPEDVATGPIGIDELSTLVVLSHGRNRWTGVMEDTEYTLGCGLPQDWPVGIENRSMHWEILSKSDSRIRMAIEDSWQDNPADRHYKDLVLEFEFVREGARVTYISEGTGSFHYHLKYPSGEIIMEGMGEGINGKNFGMSTIIDGLWKYRTSYGMNTLADRIYGPRRTVLVLDYNDYRADCADDEPSDLMNWEELVAPRHGGKVNVLYASGAVGDAFPGEIDPTTEEGLEKWRP